MNNEHKGTLRVPGATLAYEVRGRGPILLLISGGGNGSSVFSHFANLLTDRYTVVTYDRRGLSSSRLDDPMEEQKVDAHSDDAHRLLKELGSDYEPAYVFGSSGGAIVGLDLVARHPEQIYILIAHEPPTHLVPEHDPIQEMGAIREVYRQSGIVAAIHKLAALFGLSPQGQEAGEERRASVDWDQFVKDLIFLFEHEFTMYDHYQPDLLALKRATTQTRIVLAGGYDDKESTTYRSAAAVAEQLGSVVVDFPGKHAGYVTNPEAFAQRLCQVLE